MITSFAQSNTVKKQDLPSVRLRKGNDRHLLPTLPSPPCGKCTRSQTKSMANQNGEFALKKL